MPSSKRNQKKRSSTKKMRGGKCGNIFLDTGCFLKHKESALTIKKDSNCSKEKDGTWNVKITTKGWDETDEATEKKISDLSPEEIKKIMCFQKKEPEEIVEIIEKPASTILSPLPSPSPSPLTSSVEKPVDEIDILEKRSFREPEEEFEIDRERVRNPYTGRLNTEREIIRERPSAAGPFGFRSNPWGGKQKKNRSKKNKK